MVTPLPKRERKPEDAHAVIPFLLGAFGDKTNRGFYLGQPLAQYYFPSIHLETGRWELHTKRPIAKLFKLFSFWGKGMNDALRPVEIGTQKDKPTYQCALTQMLDEFEKVETLMVTQLNEANTSTIKNNLAEARAHIFEIFKSIAGSTEEQQNAFKATIRKSLSESATRYKESVEKNFSGAATEAVLLAPEFDSFFSKLLGGNLTAFKDSIALQEADALSRVKGTIKVVKEWYAAIASNIKSSNAEQTLLKKAAEAYATETGDVCKANYTRKIQKFVHDFVEDLLIERIEMFYSSVRSYFALVYGNGSSQLAEKFVDGFVSACVGKVLLRSFMLHEPAALFTGALPTGAQKELKITYEATKAHTGYMDTHQSAIFKNPSANNAAATTDLRAQLSKNLFNGNEFDGYRSFNFLFSNGYKDAEKSVDAFVKTLEDFNTDCAVKDGTTVNLEGYYIDDGWYVRDALSQHISPTRLVIADNLTKDNMYTNAVFASLYLIPASDTDAARHTQALIYFKQINSPLSITAPAAGKALELPPIPSDLSSLASSPATLGSFLRLKKQASAAKKRPASRVHTAPPQQKKSDKKEEPPPAQKENKKQTTTTPRKPIK